MPTRRLLAFGRMPLMNSSVQHIRAFHRDGVVRVAAAVDDAWIEKLREAIERGLGCSENYFRRHTLWNADEDLKAFCFNSVAPRLAVALLESNKLNLLYDQIFVKEPGSGAATPWHNDQPYWPVRGWSVATVWIALDQITAESGAMEFIRGSHRWNRWFQPFLAASDGGKAGDYEHNAEYEPLPNFDACRDELDIVSWDMQPGDALVGDRRTEVETVMVHYSKRFVTGDTAAVDYLAGVRMAPNGLRLAVAAKPSTDRGREGSVRGKGDHSRPLVRVHPPTSRKVLWATPKNMDHLEIGGRALPVDSSRAKLEELLQYGTATADTALVYEHQWKAGDVVLIDNRQVLHSTTPYQNDNDDQGQQLMHHTSMKARRPQPGWTDVGALRAHRSQRPACEP